MKTNELKKVLKPLIKQCIKEVIFEEGVLSGIISEVVKGVNTAPVIKEQKNNSNLKFDNGEVKKKLQEQSTNIMARMNLYHLNYMARLVKVNLKKY